MFKEILKVFGRILYILIILPLITALYLITAVGYGLLCVVTGSDLEDTLNALDNLVLTVKKL